MRHLDRENRAALLTRRNHLFHSAGLTNKPEGRYFRFFAESDMGTSIISGRITGSEFQDALELVQIYVTVAEFMGEPLRALRFQDVGWVALTQRRVPDPQGNRDFRHFGVFELI